jgi:hypothetical protein
MERCKFDAIDVDRPRMIGRYNPLRIQGGSYLYRGPRGPVDITVSGDGTTTSLLGPEIGSVVAPCGPKGLAEGWDEGDEPLRDGIIVPIGSDQVTFTVPLTRGLPLSR